MEAAERSLKADLPGDTGVLVALSFRSALSPQEALAQAEAVGVQPRAIVYGVDGPHTYLYGTIPVVDDAGKRLPLEAVVSRYRAFLDAQRAQTGSLAANASSNPRSVEALAARRAQEDHNEAERLFSTAGPPVIGVEGASLYRDAVDARRTHDTWRVQAGTDNCPPQVIPPEAAVRIPNPARSNESGSGSAPTPERGGR